MRLCDESFRHFPDGGIPSCLLLVGSDILGVYIKAAIPWMTMRMPGENITATLSDFMVDEDEKVGVQDRQGRIIVWLPTVDGVC